MYLEVSNTGCYQTPVKVKLNCFKIEAKIRLEPINTLHGIDILRCPVSVHKYMKEVLIARRLRP
jgi:hypothetical protein